MLDKYKHKELHKIADCNYISTNALNNIKPTDVGMEEFNAVYFYVKDLKLRRLVRTKSNGISLDRRNFFGSGYDVIQTRIMVELLVVYQRKFYKIHFCQPTGEPGGPPISGTRAFQVFREELEKDGVDIDAFMIDNGFEVKETIESPMICMERDNLKHETIKNAHHIDFHSSHPAGMAKYYPALRPTIERIYQMKEEAPKGSEERELYKAILNQTWGYLQAHHIGAKWAHISRDAIMDTNDRLLALASELRAAGRKIIAFNTDGIWYYGEQYHGEGEGPDLGQWGHDHTNCVIRFKTAGAYEYIEDGVYHPVIRGWTTLDQIKDRETEWVWGDIYKAAEYKYKFTEEEGVEKVNL